MKDWRRKNPNLTVKGLREAIAKLKQEIVYAKDEGRQEVVNAVDAILSEHESGCRYDGDKVSVKIGDRWVEKKL